MADVDELIVIDPADEGTGVPLVLVGPGSPYTLTMWRSPTPPITARWAEPDDADGEPRVASRYGNRRFPHSIEIVPPAGPDRATDAQAALAALAAKYSKLNEEGGTLRRTLPSGDAVTWDVLAASDIDPTWEVDWDTARRIRLDGLELIAKPFGRGTRVSYVSHASAGAPVLVFVEDGPAGDVPAIGELEITNNSTFDQMWVAWALQSRTYDAAASAALSYAASELTIAASALSTVSWKTVLSTQLAATGRHLTHAGEFRVFARVRRGRARGTLALAFEYALGDMVRFRRNAETTYLEPTSFGTTEVIVDLGIVTLDPLPRGPHRWEGRLVARSSLDGDASPDPTLLWLMPIERYGEVTASTIAPSPSLIAVRDGFDQVPAGSVLTGKQLPIGGAWTAAGSSTTDFTVNPGNSSLLSRSGATDATTNLSTSRIAIPSGVTVAAGSAIALNNPHWVAAGVNDFLFGVVLRFVNVSNFVAVVGWSRTDGLGLSLTVIKRVAGVETTLFSTLLPNTRNTVLGGGVLSPSGLASVLSATITAAGTLTCLISGYGFNGIPVSQETTITADADLTPRGALAAGTVGLIARASNVNSQAAADGFEVNGYVHDAAIFAGRSAEFRHDAALRESADGAVWAPMSPEGDRLTVPPAGDEGRQVRVAIKTSRSGIGAGPDIAADAISGRLHVTPRYLVVP